MLHGDSTYWKTTLKLENGGSEALRLMIQAGLREYELGGLLKSCGLRGLYVQKMVRVLNEETSLQKLSISRWRDSNNFDNYEWIVRKTRIYV